MEFSCLGGDREVVWPDCHSLYDRWRAHVGGADRPSELHDARIVENRVFLVELPPKLSDVAQAAFIVAPIDWA